MNSKDRYLELCMQEVTIPLFSQPWWLDAACGSENWDVVLVIKNNLVIGSLPYYIKRKWGGVILSQPPLTQKLGPWVRHERKLKPEKIISFQNKIIAELINNLPSFHAFIQNFHYDMTNWLAFYWKGFKQTTKYTYVIQDITDPEKVLASFSSSKRNDVNKARKLVQIKFDLSAEIFYEYYNNCLHKQGKKILYSFRLFSRLYSAGYSNSSAKTIYAVDPDNNIHAALFIVWNKQSAFYLVNALDPDYRSSSSVSLLVIETIRFLNGKADKFDFEGSMINGVERSYRNFGTIQTPYHSVHKYNSFFAKLFACYKDIRK